MKWSVVAAVMELIIFLPAKQDQSFFYLSYSLKEEFIFLFTECMAGFTV